MSAAERRRRLRLALILLLLGAAGLLAGLMAGSEGWDLAALRLSPGGELILWDIRAPRSLGAGLVGALFGLSGALAQGLFRNPLADPYLLGSAAGASLGVVIVLAAGGLLGAAIPMAGADLIQRLGLVGAAFVGALAGVSATLALARGAEQTTRLLLAGVVVGVLLGALNDLVTLFSPDALRGKQSFLLGQTGLLGWPSVTVLALSLTATLPLAWRLSRVLDALALGEDSARSLGLALPRLRVALVVLMALATGTAVAQAGLVAFVGLVAPHLVARFVRAPHGYRLVASAAMGGVLLLWADVIARSVIAPQELPVGVFTAVLGGCYLLVLLWRRGLR
ncbi:FecCD family ABC transporter permease [Sphaerotilus mobilis]|uniref:Iron complex transport system permease protein n=1 Tax=Sphaerotilus mobilis TaxID=47994 RepID=A0A4Q7LUK7_9BURK|nr:iron ABC transporter permease [Sphaerotilus mobilis]RZS58063.1 iron complex transport system permease protein [Sphaerotilus mobilis]